MTDAQPNIKTHPPANAIDVEEAEPGDEETVLPPSADAVDEQPSRYVAPGDDLTDA